MKSWKTFEKATAIAPFLYAAESLLKLAAVEGHQDYAAGYGPFGNSAGILFQVMLFIGFGIAVLRRRLWGAYGLLILTGIELVDKVKAVASIPVGQVISLPILVDLVLLYLCASGALALIFRRTAH